MDNDSKERVKRSNIERRIEYGVEQRDRERERVD